MAEYVMKNHKDLNVMYVIWGQKIWNPSRDEVTGWDGWRDMEDRGDDTANHWYVCPLSTTPALVLSWRNALANDFKGIITTSASTLRKLW